MQQYFNDLADFAKTKLKGDEVYTAFLSGEDSDFCRLSGAKVRQAGNVKQNSLSFRLIEGRKHAEASISLAGSKEEDQRRLDTLIKGLRDQVKEVPDDPHQIGVLELQNLVQPVDEFDVRIASQFAERRGTFDRLVAERIEFPEQFRTIDFRHVDSVAE